MSTPLRVVISLTLSKFQALEVWGCSKMKYLPARLCISHLSIDNLTISMAPARAAGSTSPWFAIENAVQGGEIMGSKWQSLFIIFLIHFWSFLLWRSNTLPVEGSRKLLSIDHPPARPFPGPQRKCEVVRTLHTCQTGSACLQFVSSGVQWTSRVG